MSQCDYSIEFQLKMLLILSSLYYSLMLEKWIHFNQFSYCLTFAVIEALNFWTNARK